MTMEKEIDCPCPKIDCERRGLCADCFSRHARSGEFPYCLDRKHHSSRELRSRVIARLKAAGLLSGNVQ